MKKAKTAMKKPMKKMKPKAPAEGQD